MAVDISIISVQKIKEKPIETLIQEYVKRLPPHWKLSIESCRGERIKSPSDEEQREEGSALFLAKAQPTELLICLDEAGKEFTSTGLSKLLHGFIDEGRRKITFGIGGPAGWSESVKREADLLLSLGKLTFPYQFSLLLLVEQLYRAHTIHRNLPYHK